jgi:hypothetical protein
MSNHLEEVQIKMYQEHLMSVDPAQWQWFAAQQCFEVGDAAARPRVYFDIEEQYATYVLSVYLEVDGNVAGSSILRVGKARPSDCDELLMHITAEDHPPILVVLLTRLLRNRNVMQTTPRPAHLRARIDSYLTIAKRKLLIDLPHNLQERLQLFKIERSATRVLPKSRRN